MPDPARVLVLAPNWLGDAVMALPAVADVRRHFPAARLIVAARAPVAGLFRIVPVVDEVRTLAWGGRLLQPAGLRTDAARLRDSRADVAILLPNSFASAWLARWAGLPARWGYDADMRGWLLSRAVPKPAIRMHQGRYYQHLVRTLGMHNGPLEPVLAVPEALADAVRRQLADRGWREPSPLVVVAPGAAYGSAKRWPPGHFAGVIARLTAERDVTCVLVGSRADVDTTREVAEAVPAAARRHLVDLAGQTTLEELAALMTVADACVSNDSGAMHLAAAAGVPLAALFGPTNEKETAPLSRSGRAVRVLSNPVSCRPCMLRECPIDHRCMKNLEPGTVFDAVRELMPPPEGGR